MSPVNQSSASSNGETTTVSPIDEVLRKVRSKDAHKPEFLQCIEEISHSLEVVFAKKPELVSVFERLIEPERVIQFRIVWMDDKLRVRVNRGWRVQYSSTLGPYKGGLRFHPTVTSSVLEFLGLEQTFKNALTGLPLGGGKGGSDFDPKNCSDGEMMRFCQAYMSELFRHIGANVDVPAGDIGVGGREIGYMFGQYKKLTNSFQGSITGKAEAWGGSPLRPEATGFGLVFFAAEAVETYHGTTLRGKRCVVSGSGNVSLFCAEQLMKHSALVLTVSDSNGYLYEPQGMSVELLAALRELKEVKRGRLSQLDCAKYSPTLTYVDGKSPFAHVKCDYVFPCATQNEVTLADAEAMVAASASVSNGNGKKGKGKESSSEGGIRGIFEGANMPCTNEAIALFNANKILFGPSKAANAGGVAVSGLEMSQNSVRMTWTRDEVEIKLRAIMKDIFNTCRRAAKEHGMDGDLQFGANVAGFTKVARAMEQQGLV